MRDTGVSEQQFKSTMLRRREIKDGGARVAVEFLVCEAMEDAGFVNAFSTRLGGVSPLPDNDLNLGYFKGDEPGNVDENRRRFLKAAGAEGSVIVTARQTHSTDRAVIESAAPTRVATADALITRQAGVLLGIQTADCLPVLIADPKTGTAAAIHAGWRGTAGRIVERTVADLMLSHGVNPRTCIAALGPFACGSCYEVGEEVIARFKKEFGYWRKLLTNFKEGGKAHLDVRAANLQQLLFCGFNPERIYAADSCTMHQNELFFSHRKEHLGRPGGVGRMLSVIGRPATSP
jgi:YfiH family protein